MVAEGAEFVLPELFRLLYLVAAGGLTAPGGWDELDDASLRDAMDAFLIYPNICAATDTGWIMSLVPIILTHSVLMMVVFRNRVDIHPAPDHHHSGITECMHMLLNLAIYVLNVVLNTLIISLDILIIWATLRLGELRHNLILHIIIAAMVMDIAVYMKTILHDVPSFAMNTDISAGALQYVYVLILSSQWFSQLLFLPVLSVIHFIAVFSPTKFRSISRKHVCNANIAIVMFGFVLTVPFFTKYCAYTYVVDGHYWYFDFKKPYTYLYSYINLLLQGLCVVVVVIIDAFIIWKVFRLRTSAKKRRISSVPTYPTSMKTTNTTKKSSAGREARLAMNFLLLSICFLVMTTCYNFIKGYSMWKDLAIKLSSNLNLSKWAVYALGNAVIRNKILGIFSIHNNQDNKTTCIVTKA